MEQDINSPNDEIDDVLPSDPFYDFTETQSHPNNHPNSPIETHDPLPNFSSLSLSSDRLFLPLLPSSSSSPPSNNNSRKREVNFSITPPPPPPPQPLMGTSLSSFNECRCLECRMKKREHEIDTETEFLRVLVRNPWQVMKDAAMKSLFCEFVKVINQTTISMLLRVLLSDVEKFIRTCCNFTGQHTMSALMEQCNSNDQHEMLCGVFSDKRVILYLVADQNGYHMVEKLITFIPSQYMNSILNIISSNGARLAIHQNGCKLLQNYADHAIQCDRRNLLAGRLSFVCETLLLDALLHALELAENEYGNYVVQYMITEVPRFKSLVLESLQGHYSALSLQKHSSNVVEKCINYSNDIEFRMIVNELFYDPITEKIVGDQFGNYVIQTAIRKAEGSVFEEIFQIITTYRNNFSSNMMYSRRVFRALDNKKRSQQHTR